MTTSTPHEQANDASRRTVFTYPGELTVRAERIFHGPVERVWALMTDPEMIPKWWGPERQVVTVNEMDVRVGGRWDFESSEAGTGVVHGFHGEYLELTPPHEMRQTFNYRGAPGAGNQVVEHATLEQLDDGTTRFVVTSTFARQDAFDGMVQSGMEPGAAEGHDRLDALVRGNASESHAQG